VRGERREVREVAGSGIEEADGGVMVTEQEEEAIDYVKGRVFCEDR
jgi:hypothetical protein